MKTFYTSDQHFCHSNIILFCNRPFKSSQEMNEFMIEKWNSVVTNEDVVIHGGDFCLSSFDKQKEIFDRLNGQKYIIRGNHDPSKTRLKRIGFLGVYDYLYDKEILIVHKPEDALTKYKELYDKCRMVLYGHIHDKIFNELKFKSMCVELNNYTPFKIL